MSVDETQYQPTIRFSDIAGYSGLKRLLEQYVVLPCLHPFFNQAAAGFNPNRPHAPFPFKSVLLFGPPGTGKTYLSQGLAHRLGIRIVEARVSDFSSSMLNESQLLIRAFFQRVQTLEPCVVFLDEVDGFLKTRESSEHMAYTQMKTEFLSQLNDLANPAEKHQVVFIAATNVPWSIDPAVISRFHTRLYMPLPEFEDRLEILQKIIEKAGIRTEISEQQYRTLAAQSYDFSGRDIDDVVRKAMTMPFRRCQNAQRFKEVRVGFSQKKMFTPCDENDVSGSEGARLMTILEVPSGSLLLNAPLTFEDLETAVRSKNVSKNTTWTKKYEDFNRQYGSAGIPGPIITKPNRSAEILFYVILIFTPLLILVAFLWMLGLIK